MTQTTILEYNWKCPNCGHTKLCELYCCDEIIVPITHVDTNYLPLRVLQHNHTEIVNQRLDSFYCPNCHINFCQNTGCPRRTDAEMYSWLMERFPQAFLLQN